MLALIEYVSLIHLIREIANLYLHGNELHGGIIVAFIDAYSGIVVNPAQLTVHEAFIQPFLAFGFSDTIQITYIAIDGLLIGGAVNSGIMFTDIICPFAVEFLNGMNLLDIKPIKPAFL